MIIDQRPKGSRPVEFTGVEAPRKSLSPKELQSFWDMASKLVENRQISLDYLLERSSYSLTKSERNAWLACYLLQRFVEENHKFPNTRELNDLLDMLNPSINKIAEFKHKDMTQFDFWSNRAIMSAMDRVRKEMDSKEDISHL